MTEVAVPVPTSARWQHATISAIVPRTPRIKSFYLELAEPFEHRAGQHVDVRLTAPDGYRAVRSYSIASAPGRAEAIELAIERLDDGEVSPFFHDVAEVGDGIELRGPLGGHFVWEPSDGGPLLLIGGGSGVVPLMAMLRQRSDAATDVRALLLLSARHWEDLLYREELLSLDARADGFTLVLALTREAKKREGDFDRRVDAAMMSDVAQRLAEPPRQVFICGTNGFVNSAADGAIAAGIPRSIIRTERYGG